MAINKILLPLIISGLLGAIGTWLVRVFAWRFNIVNKPNVIIPQHTKATAYLGGTGIFIGAAAFFLIPFLVGDFDFSLEKEFWAPAFLYLLLGIFDDLREYKPFLKFGIQIAIAVLAVSLGIQLRIKGINYIDFPVSVFWILTLVNAFNLTDVCDGLVGGLSAISLMFLGFLLPDYSLLCYSIAGGCFGFLVFNKPPASIFMGDAGSHFLGFAVAAISVNLVSPDTIWPALPVMGLIAGVPLFELSFLVIVRIRKGIPWWQGSPDHFSLRLQQAGLSKLQTDLVAWANAVLFGIAAVIVGRYSAIADTLIFVLVLSLIVFSWFSLLKWDVKSI